MSSTQTATFVEATNAIRAEGSSDHPVKKVDNITMPYYGGPAVPERDDVKFLLTDAEQNPVKVTLTDVRDDVQRYSLDRSGFQYVHEPELAVSDQQAAKEMEGDEPWYRNRDLVNKYYVPALEKSVARRLGATTFIAASGVVREVASWDTTDKKDYNSGRQGPAPRPHIDYSTFGAHAMLKNMNRGIYEETGKEDMYTMEQKDAAMRKRDEVVQAIDRGVEAASVPLDEWDGSNYDGPRWMILSLWRPFETVRRDPLAVMDRSTLKEEEDLVEMKRWYSTFKGFNKGFESGNCLIKAPPVGEADGKRSHRWCWMSGQGPEDLLMIKLYDSEAVKAGTKVTGSSPHAAIQIDGTENEPPRKSMEMRVYLFW